MSTLFLASYLALWLLIATMAVLVLLLYRHFGLISMGTLDGVQRDGLAVGQRAPAIMGVDALGVETQWQTTPGRRHLLLFASNDCAPCARVIPYVERLSANARGTDGLSVVAIVPGPSSEAARFHEKFSVSFQCIADNGRDASGLYRVRVTPFAFIVGDNGLVLSKGLCSDPSKLHHLLLSSGLTRTDSVVGIEGMIALDKLPQTHQREAI